MKKLTEIAGKANENNQQFVKTLEKNQNFVGNQFALISLLINLDILREYHEWLMQKD